MGRQITIKNTVSIDFISTFLDSNGVFDCRLPGVVWGWTGIEVNNPVVQSESLPIALQGPAFKQVHVKIYLANSEVQDERPQNAAYYHGLYCLLILNEVSEKEYNAFLKVH